ncbi:hypothetical protein FALBO_6867 [Fusarium albosuccineum]|uniref:Uncharacterized protein n=1 Tax=Fusarium albosuccineum TaxID=1237068 RepID=A0A8H4LCA4_9HYPO|nr:hypothetical protein FALBO_6867 [Fusarium albosuccineum]
MAELTVGYVAGIIAFGIVIAQLWCPTAITFVLAGQLRDRETAATWTTAGRFLQSSLWPALLQADSAKSRGVRRSVSLMALAVPLLGLLVSLAGVITPLGLYEQDELDNESTSASFQYVEDSSAFLLGTSPRDNKTFTRTCQFTPQCLAPCPYTSDVTVYESDGLSSNCTTLYDTNTTVPSILYDIYMSGTKKRRTTVSNYFDIEWRQLTTRYYRNYNNGTPIAVGIFRALESFALKDEIRLVEGLIVDGKNGGIGLRNNTLPADHSRGATWSEDLLFLEPETECANLNVSLDFEISTSSKQMSGVAVTKLFMTDHGGFAHINSTNPKDDQRNGENKPGLKMRAYQAAWYTNGATMLLMNVTDPTDKVKGTKAFARIDSKMDNKWKLPITESDHTRYQSLDFLSDFGHFVGMTDITTDGEDLYPNPHNVTPEYFDAPKIVCQGTSLNAPAKLNNTYVTCSLVRGVPERVDDGPPNLFEDGSKWSAPLYTCASAVKATIKRVTFFHNGTSDNLEKLVVKEVKEKEYKDEEDMPIWGVEDWNLGLAQFQPIWGIVDPSFKGFRNVSTTQAPSLYMLGSAMDNMLAGVSSLNPSSPTMNLPGSIVPISALHTIVNNRDTTEPVIDVAAQGSMSLWLKWKRLSASEDSVPMIVKLLWNDLAASALVGSKGVLGARNEEPAQAASVRVVPTVHRIKYRWVFGIPAFIVIVCMGLILLMVAGSAVAGKSGFDLLRHRLKQVAVGRVLTTIFHPDSSSFIMSPADWSRANGEKHIDMAGGRPAPSALGGPTLAVVTPVPPQFSPPPLQQFYQAQAFPPQPYGQQQPPPLWRGSPVTPDETHELTYFPERKV